MCPYTLFWIKYYLDRGKYCTVLLNIVFFNIAWNGMKVSRLSNPFVIEKSLVIIRCCVYFRKFNLLQ